MLQGMGHFYKKKKKKKSMFKKFQTVVLEWHKHSPQHSVRIHLNHVLPVEILILEDFHASLVVY